MPSRRFTHRLSKITYAIQPTIDPSFLAFAWAVIEFSGAEPTPEAVEQLAHW